MLQTKMLQSRISESKTASLKTEFYVK